MHSQRHLYDNIYGSKNVLHDVLEIRHIRDILNINKLRTYTRLLNNRDTRDIIFYELSHTKFSKSFTSDVVDICNSYNINIVDLTINITTPKLPILFPQPDEQAEIIITELQELINTWYLPDSRNIFKSIIERNILRE